MTRAALGWIAAAIAAITATAAAPDTYWLHVIAMVAITTLVGVGLNVLVGLTGQVSLGQSGFYLVGAYAVGIVTVKYGGGYWTGFAIAMVVSVIIGALLAAPALRVRGPYLAMVTIAFGLIVENVTVEWESFTGGFNGLQGIARPALAGHVFTLRELVFLTVALAALSLWAYARLAGSDLGRALRAVRDSETAAAAIGLNPLALRTLAFAIAALTAGIAGALYAPLAAFISPESFGFYQSILFLLATILGGLSTTSGPLLGALALVILPELLSGFSEYRLLFFGVLLLVILALAPDGIAGSVARHIGGKTPPRQHPQVEPSLALVARGDDRRALQTADLSISFGGVRSVVDVGFTAAPGHVTAIIGPNGAGKTTLLNLIGGFYRPDRGTVRLGDVALVGLANHRIASAGVARTFQATQLFGTLTALENLTLAIGRAGDRARLRADETRLALELLAFVGYRGDPDARTADLPFVDRRLVEIARALAMRPHVLLLDEPAAGLNREDKDHVGAVIRRIADAGLVVLLVEHDMDLVMGTSDRIAVLDAGSLIAFGPPAEVRSNPDVVRAYLGALGEAALPARTGRAPEGAAILDVRDLRAGYGRIEVLHDVSMDVRPGELVAVIGANGAGKSTLLRAIVGLLAPRAGRVRFADADVGAEPPHRKAARGLVLVPEGRQVFPELSVRDNIRLGAYTRRDDRIGADLEAQFARFPRLRERLHQRAGLLSGGEQQMLAVARGLMAHPKVLLLDEPSLGLAPKLVDDLYRALAQLRDEGVTLVVVDQLARLALAIADRGYVLETGRVAHAGPAAELRVDPNVESAYLGTAH